MAVRDGRGDVKQTTTGFRGPLMVQSLTSAKSKFLSLGVTYPQKFQDYGRDLWRKTLDVNLCAPFFLSQKLLPLLKESESASIINITSLNAELAFPDNPAYVSSKAALSGLTRSMALDLGQLGIRVNSVAPGYIKTKMTGESYNNPIKRKERSNRTVLGRWGTPNDLLGPLLFLASNMSSYVTGHSLFVDGGWKIRGL
ncbi:MAG: SDR family oxidoreductase [Candidatus Peribacteraceae bacterium]|jgi:NAD(P)-dependent dehydrogenase (short-subunit alcohol dehydrogenase family)|nr:SDR family oxidoreductase [Candidatus Peribacteraceae bacterium]